MLSACPVVSPRYCTWCLQWDWLSWLSWQVPWEAAQQNCLLCESRKSFDCFNLEYYWNENVENIRCLCEGGTAKHNGMGISLLVLRFYTKKTQDWKLWLTSLGPSLLPKVRCKMIGCLKVQEHQLLLEVSFVVIIVFRDDLLEQIYSKYLWSGWGLLAGKC